MEIKIQQGEGISQAILRKLKNEEGIDKLNKEAWKSIFNEFQADENSTYKNRKIKNEWSEFSGKNVKSSVGDDININDSVWAKIVDIAKNGPKSKQVVTVAEPEVKETNADTDSTTNAAQTEVADSLEIESQTVTTDSTTNAVQTEVADSLKTEPQTVTTDSTTNATQEEAVDSLKTAVQPVVSYSTKKTTKSKATTPKKATKAENADSTNKTTQSKAADSTVKAEDTDSKSGAITKNDCEQTKCSSIFYHKATDTYYKEVNGELEKLEPYYSDTHIVDISEDGSWWETGQVWEWKRQRGPGKEFHYAVSESHIKGGEEIERYIYDVDTQQPLEEGDFKNPNKYIWYEYDDNGNKIKTYTETDNIPVFGSTDYMYKTENHKNGKTEAERYDKDDNYKYKCSTAGSKKVTARDVVRAESPEKLSDLFKTEELKQPYGLPKQKPESSVPLKRGEGFISHTNSTVTAKASNGNSSNVKSAASNNSKVAKTASQKRTTDCKGVYYDVSTKKHYRLVNGKYQEIKPKYEECRISQFDKDGSHWERTLKTYNGKYVSVHFDKNGKEIGRMSRDSKTQRITYKEYKDKNGQLVRKHYDEKTGKLVSKEYVQANTPYYEFYKADGSLDKRKSYYIIKSSGKEYKKYYLGGGEEVK